MLCFRWTTKKTTLILKRAGYEKFFQFISLRTTRSARSGVEKMEMVTIGVGITVGMCVWVRRGSLVGSIGLTLFCDLMKMRMIMMKQLDGVVILVGTLLIV